MTVTHPLLPWGGVSVPAPLLAPHFLVLGQNQSGKTLLIRQLIASALSPDGHGPLHRALVLDAKYEWYPILRGIGVPDERIVVLNPFDERCTAWDVARDTEDAGSVRQLASILAPPEPRSQQPFFANAAQELVAAVIETFRKLTPGAWTLNDLVECFTDDNDLKMVLSLTGEGRQALARYVNGNEKSSSDVLSTVDTKLRPLAVAARLSARCPRRISLRSWVNAEQPSALLLARDDSIAQAMDPLNRALFKRLSQLALGRVEEDPVDKTWFFLDEARWAGELDGLQGLLLKGRSKGVHVVMGVQEVQGMRHVYGQYQADEILSQFGNLALLRLSCPDSMTWAVRIIGRYEAYVEGFGESRTSSQHPSSSTSRDWRLQERPGALEQQFRAFPLPTASTGIWGAFLIPGHAWLDCVPPAFVNAHMKPKADVPGFVPRPAHEQERLPWSAEFRRRLQPALRRSGA